MNDDRIVGPWRPVGEDTYYRVNVPTVVEGMANTPVASEPIIVRRRTDRRAVWKFVGYEERCVES